MAPRARSSRPQRAPAGTARLAGAVGLLVLLGGFVVVILASRDRGGTQQQAAPPVAGTTPKPASQPRPARPAAVRIRIVGIGAYDPEGDGRENDADARLATDGDRATAWKTERYHSAFGKSGVGLVLDAGRPVRARRLTVVTDTPGFDAQVREGASATGPFEPVSGSRALTGRTTFALHPGRARYVLLWITSIPPGGVAAVNEVSVTGGG